MTSGLCTASAVTILVVQVIVPTAARSQEVPDSARLAAVRRLTPGTLVRVHEAGRGRIEGRLREASATLLTIDTATEPRELSTLAFDSLWVRGTAGKTGALVGAIGGGISGGVLGGLAHTVGCADTGGCSEAIPLGIVLGAGIGALGGFVIGSMFPKWHRRVP